MKKRDLVVVGGILLAAILLILRAKKNEPDGNTAAAGGGNKNVSASLVPDQSNFDQPRKRNLSNRKLVERPVEMTTESGLKYEVLQEGNGARPEETSTVEVHYQGFLEDGTVFDSSIERGISSSLGLSQVIKGWTEGLQMMNEGAKYRFTIPSHLAYGERGAGDLIPPNATLVFEIELISIKEP